MQTLYIVLSNPTKINAFQNPMLFKGNYILQEHTNNIIRGFLYNTFFLETYEIFMITIKYFYKINTRYT